MENENNNNKNQTNEGLAQASRELFSAISPNELVEDLNNLFTGYLKSDMANNQHERIKLYYSWNQMLEFLASSEIAIEPFTKDC